MTTESLSVEPVRDGYTFQSSYPVIETVYKGGVSFKRQDFLYSPHVVTLNWVLTSDLDYTNFMGHFRTTVKNGAQPFLMNLLTDIGEPTLHKCRVLAGLPKISQKRGTTYYVSCTLEVQPNPTYTDLITYEEPGNIVLNVSNPPLVGPIVAGDFVQVLYTEGIHPTGPTPLNLDGVYEVASTTDGDTLTLTSPAAVNSDWTVLATLGAPGRYGSASFGNVISTITRIPT